ncbi:MAG: porin, partial [Halorhodospira sp.]
MRRAKPALVLSGIVGLLPWGAQASEVSLYGQVHAGLNTFSYDDSKRVTEITGQGRTWVGFSGSTPLENGWDAIGTLEWNTFPHLGESGFKRRASYVGVATPYGEAVIGSVAAAYKMGGGVGWDPLVTTELQQRRSGGMSGGAFGHNSFVDRAIQYTSPELNGFKLQLQLGTEENNDSRTVADPSEGDADAELQQGDALASVRYTGIPDWDLIAAAVRLDEPYTEVDGVDDGDTSWKLGARWAPEGYSLAYQYESVEIIRGPGGAGRIDNLVGDPDNRVDGEDDGKFRDGRFMDAVDHHALIGTYEQGRNTWVLGLSHADADAREEDVSAVTAALVHQPAPSFRLYAGVQHQAF